MTSFEQRYNDLDRRIRENLGLIAKEKDLGKKIRQEPDLKKKLSIADELNRLRVQRAKRTGDWFYPEEEAEGMKKYEQFRMKLEK